MTFALTWLGQVLGDAGLEVIPETGWMNRGHGDMAGWPKGVMLHHTAGPKDGDCPSLNTVMNGRPDLEGPLSHLLLARSGAYHLIAAGKCWHAGGGEWQRVVDGNGWFIGIEAENTGRSDDPWPDVQYRAYVTGVVALLKHLGQDASWACGHKEYAQPVGRKIDPSFDMVEFRTAVQNLLNKQ